MSDLTWKCARCRFGIAADSGGVRVTFAEILQFRAAEAEYREQHPDGQAVELHDFLDGPPEIRWTPLHYGCDEQGADAYCIDAGMLGTLGGLMQWTAHLMPKNWLEFTDWDDLLREAAGEKPSDRVSVSRSAA